MQSLQSIVKAQTRDFNPIRHPLFMSHMLSAPFGKDKFVLVYFQDYDINYGEAVDKWIKTDVISNNTFSYYEQAFMYKNQKFFLLSDKDGTPMMLDNKGSVYEELKKEYDRLAVIQQKLDLMPDFGAKKPQFIIDEERLKMSRMPRSFCIYICDSTGQITKIIRIPKVNDMNNFIYISLHKLIVYKHYLIVSFNNPPGFGKAIYAVIDTKTATYRVLKNDYDKYHATLFGDNYIIVYGSYLMQTFSIKYTAISYEEFMLDYDINNYTEIENNNKEISIQQAPFFIDDILVFNIGYNEQVKTLLIPVGKDKSPVVLDKGVNLVYKDVVEIGQVTFITMSRHWGDTIELMRIKRLDNDDRMIYIADIKNISYGKINIQKEAIFFEHSDKTFNIIKRGKEPIYKLADCLYYGKLFDEDIVPLSIGNEALFGLYMDRPLSQITYLSFLNPLKLQDTKKSDVEFLFESFIGSYACSEEIKNKFQVVQRRLYNEEDLRQEKEAFISFVKDYAPINEYHDDKPVEFVFKDI